MRNKHVLISGASIAGMTAAYWLAKYGFKPVIIERSPHLRPAGNGVDISGQAIEIIRRMSIYAQVQAMAADVKGMSFIDATGKSFAQVSTQASQPTAFPGVEIFRGDLINILYGLTKDSVEYIFNDSVTKISEHGQGINIAFEHAAPRDFDLVIGADGFHSNIRRLVFGPEARFTHHLGYYAAFAKADSSLAENRRVTMYNEPGRMTGIYRSGHSEQAKSYFLFRQDEPLTYDYHNLNDQKLLLKQGMAGMGWQTEALLKIAATDPDLYFDALSQIHMPEWSRGRVALIGDAAYCASPVTGAGAELAITGAYIIAGELFAASGAYKTAFKQYETVQRPLVKQKQSQSFAWLLAPKNSLYLHVRNLLIRSPLMAMLSGLGSRLDGRIKPVKEY